MPDDPEALLSAAHAALSSPDPAARRAGVALARRAAEAGLPAGRALYALAVLGPDAVPGLADGEAAAAAPHLAFAATRDPRAAGVLSGLVPDGPSGSPAIAAALALLRPAGRDVAMARGALQRAAALGEPEAWFWLGQLDRFWPRGEPEGAALAARGELRKAARAGLVAAMAELGDDLALGRWAEAEPTEGRHWLIRAAQAGDAWSATLLAGPADPLAPTLGDDAPPGPGDAPTLSRSTHPRPAGHPRPSRAGE